MSIEKFTYIDFFTIDTHFFIKYTEIKRGNIMIRYYKLFDLLNRKGMKKTDLLQVISRGTLSKLSKGGIIQTDIIEKICDFLNCQPGDIMENVKFETETDKNGTLWYATDQYNINHDENEEVTRLTKDPNYKSE